jgi:1-acyl-sn-glycerol-3-phosphate acyltransferase
MAMERVRQALRLAGLCLLFGVGLLLELLYRLLLGPSWYLRPAGQRVIGRWMRTAARLLGLRIEVHCPPCEGPVLMVANHVSWLDIIAIGATRPATFVAKAPVRHWPILGRLASLSGTRFLERESLAGLCALVQDLSKLLEQGASVAVFPEGTSTSGEQVLPFSSALFQSAVSSGAQVQAISLRYGSCPFPDPLAPFVGDADFVSHLLSLLKRAETQVTLVFAPPISAVGRQRQSLAEYTRGQILEQLQRGTTRVIRTTHPRQAA